MMNSNSVQGQRNLSQMTPAQIQQLKQQQLAKQQLLLQQKQNQLQQNRPRPNAQNYHFASSSQEILRKYAKYPASLSFHIFETHYRFNNSQDSNIIPKNSPMIKSFLNHVMKEQIPIEMSELLKDFSIRSYDGCLILQVYDHRNIVNTANNSRNSETSTASSGATANSNSNTSDDKSDKTEIKSEKSNGTTDTSSSPSTTVPKPKTYRTLLCPTQLSIYYDLLYHTDSALSKFTDQLSLQMESEILTLTNRKLDLSVPLNPYLCDDYLKPEEEYPKKVWDDTTQDYKLEHRHRQAVENPPRKLRQDELVLHKSSEYEEIMFLLSNKHNRSDDAQENRLVVVGSSSSAAAATAASSSAIPTINSSKPTSKEGTTGPDGKLKKGEKPTPNVSAASTINSSQTTSRSTGQFMRLRLIEEIRKKREADKARQDAKIQEQANAINQNNTRTIVMPNQKKPDSSSPDQMNLNMKQPVPANAARPGQPLAGPQAKRQKIENMPMQMNNIGGAAQPLQQPVQTQLTPQQQAQYRQRLQQQQQQQQQKPPQSQPQQPAATASNVGGSAPNAPNPSAGSKPPSIQQQQQQQIFQNSLTAEEQQHFKQLQSRMSAFAQMSSSGVAPTGQQLSPQQQQQALQQAKLIQQQLVQKFPVYFQRLRQFQLIQQQRLQKAQQQRNAPPQLQNTGGQFNQQRSNVAGKTIPGSGMNSQPMSASQFQTSPNMGDKKKRVYKKKA